MNMHHKAAAASIAAICLGSILSGCGRPAVGADPKPTSGPTPVPHVVSAYASLAQPLLSESVGEVTTLLAQMKHDQVSEAGNQCTLVGGDLSNMFSTFQGIYHPHQADQSSRLGSSGFKLILSSTEECSIASDQGSKKAMKVARADMWSGLKQLRSAASAIQGWSAS
ncbi:MAG: hypothetical protein ACRDFS_01350 [Chloroflexota bacterium]